VRTPTSGKSPKPGTSIPGLGLLLALGLTASVVTVGCGATSEEIVFSPGMRLERTIAGGRPHHFHGTLEADRFLELGVEQQGLDVAVFLYDPADRLLFEIDSPTGQEGWETVRVVTPAGGEYRLEVRPYAKGAEGRFALEVFALRPATAEDRWRGESAAALARAERRRQRGDFRAAAESLRGALPGLEALGDREGAAPARWRLGEALIETGELLEALAALEHSVAGFKALGDGVGEARALNDLGALWRELGEPQQAFSAHRRSLELYREAGVASGEGSALNNLGLVAETVGDLAGALDLYEQALDIWRRLGRRAAEAATLQNLGSLYALIGRDDEAFDLLQQAVDLLAAEGEERRQVAALVAVGWAHYLAGQPERALERYAQAIALAQRLDDRLGEAGALDRRGTAYRTLGRTVEAAAAYESALATFRSAGGRLGQGHALANLGWLELAGGDVEAASRRLRESLAILSESGDPNGETYVLVGLARAARLRGEYGPARRHLDRAVELVEGLRTEVRGELSRSYFLATRYDVFEELVTLLMELDQREPAAGYARQALEYAERARARSLLEGLTRAEGTPSDSNDADQPRRRRMLAEIRALEARRMALAEKGADDPEIERLEQLLRQRWLAVERLEGSVGAADVALTAEQIQALLDGETMLLAYFLAEPQSFAWTVDRERIEVHRLPGRERIEERARRVAAALPRSHEVAFAEQAQRTLAALSEAVIEPLSPRLAGHHRLVVLADGALHYVPFAALAASRGDSAEPLLAGHEIVALPSAAVLAHQRRTLAGRSPASGIAAVIADPVFEPEDERLTGVPASPQAIPPDLDRAVKALDLGRLERLRFSADEAAAILALMPEGAGLRALGFRADRELVESGALGHYRIVHFASHGLLHPVHPGLSGVVLSLLDERGRSQDGFLRAHEIAALDLPVELVVLSACSTGLGREIRGEGLVGLPQAFFRAGARRVIVSSWNVNDSATAELMASFYRHLLDERLTPAAALRQAQLAMLAEKRWSAPYFWSPFSLQGDWR